MRVLVADDDVMSRSLLKAALTNWGYDVVVTQDGEEALMELSKPDCPRLAIIDWMMPKLDGPALCREIRTRNIEPYVYVLLLTAREGNEVIVDAIDAGADDFVMKPFKAHELRARLRAGERIVQLQAELHEARESLQVQAMHDALTGLWNRRAIREALDVELSRSTREGSSLGVILADVDHFKRINDTHGHPAGDAVLCEVSKRLKNSLRRYDRIGRYGGEEFLMFAPTCDAGIASIIGERLCKSLNCEPILLPNSSIPVTVSLGIAVTSPSRMFTIDELLQLADEALYQAKNDGRNCFRLANSEAKVAAERIQMESQALR